ncbi:MAG: hypothetical protein BWY71_00987 [Planctomycetes bacterium ADurb.Bin412]|nr:MAG: hypothetical protein BWY71_00987 [Planctomycetes bacterium ADurb.Bin412]
MILPMQRFRQRARCSIIFLPPLEEIAGVVGVEKPEYLGKMADVGKNKGQAREKTSRMN